MTSASSRAPAEFDALLAFLCPHPESARPEAYARMRRKLEDLFRARGHADPPGLADETLDRVAKKAAEGFVADRPAAFVHGVARRVGLEDTRRQARISSARPEELPAAPIDAVAEVHARVLDHCLQTLRPADRELLLDYHRGDGRGRIDGRRALAERLGLTMANLRVRAFRIRTLVEHCVRNRLSDETNPDAAARGVS